MSITRGAHSRSVAALLATSLALPVLACRAPVARNETQVRIARRGADVIAVGGAPQLDDSIPGDAMLAGGQLRFSGATGEDYIGAGGSQSVTGRIHGSLRAAGGEIHVAAPIDRNATIAGGRVAIDSLAVVGRNAYIAGGEVRMAGTVRETLQITGGTVFIDGTVGGDVHVSAGELRVGPRARIDGSLYYRVPAGKARVDPAARIRGRVLALPAQDWSGAARLFRALLLIGFLVAGAVAVALAPRVAIDAAERLRERPGQAALVGFLWLVLVPIAAVIVAITLVGLPLALLACAIYLVVAYLGRVVLALWLGRLLLGPRAAGGRGGIVVGFLAGAIILAIVALIPVLGGLVWLVATIVGVGALLVAVRAWSRGAEEPRTLGA
ncbi:MAG TPA: polymer-forming cytoskeletal protein [Gemmatimonadaceae bacterium]|nr:polymer-forming cytoskeletal protein [Gemmatimonadaceae bacterium]